MTQKLYSVPSFSAQVDHLLHASNRSLLDELPQSIDKPVSAMDSRFSPLIPRLAWYYCNSSMTKKESGMWARVSPIFDESTVPAGIIIVLLDKRWHLMTWSILSTAENENSDKNAFLYILLPSERVD
jgi:hypothetical protein